MDAKLLPADLKELIRPNQLLAQLRPASKRHLLAGARFQQFEKEAIICRQHGSALRFWLVLSGEVKLMIYTRKGAGLVVDIVLPNEVFGVLCYHPKPVYPYTAVGVRRQTGLVSFRLKDLIDELPGNPRLQGMLLKERCCQLWQAQQLRGLWFEEVPIRLGHALLYLHEKFGKVIPETRATLAELAGTSVETAIRLTNTLTRRGILTTRRGEIEILSLAGVRAFAEGEIQPA